MGDAALLPPGIGNASRHGQRCRRTVAGKSALPGGESGAPQPVPAAGALSRPGAFREWQPRRAVVPEGRQEVARLGQSVRPSWHRPGPDAKGLGFQAAGGGVQGAALGRRRRGHCGFYHDRQSCRETPDSGRLCRTPKADDQTERIATVQERVLLRETRPLPLRLTLFTTSSWITGRGMASLGHDGQGVPGSFRLFLLTSVLNELPADTGSECKTPEFGA